MKVNHLSVDSEGFLEGGPLLSLLSTKFRVRVCVFQRFGGAFGKYGSFTLELNIGRLTATKAPVVSTEVGSCLPRRLWQEEEEQEQEEEEEE